MDRHLRVPRLLRTSFGRKSGRWFIPLHQREPNLPRSRTPMLFGFLRRRRPVSRIHLQGLLDASQAQATARLSNQTFVLVRGSQRYGALPTTVRCVITVGRLDTSIATAITDGLVCGDTIRTPVARAMANAHRKSRSTWKATVFLLSLSEDSRGRRHLVGTHHQTALDPPLIPLESPAEARAGETENGDLRG